MSHPLVPYPLPQRTLEYAPLSLPRISRDEPLHFLEGMNLMQKATIQHYPLEEIACHEEKGPLVDTVHHEEKAIKGDHLN